MKKLLNVFVYCFFVLFCTKLSATSSPTLHMVLDKGVVVIETFTDKAPKTVKRIVELAESGFYDGLTFHRVIAGFMAQGGDPNGNGTGGSGKNLKAEFKGDSRL